MNNIFVMRRANGDLFTERVRDVVVVPVFEDRDTVDRYKARNPELMLYFPARLDKSILASATRSKESREFFLLSPDAPDADLDQGKLISSDELASMSGLHAEPSHSRA
jgi:hypothetical protein